MNHCSTLDEIRRLGVRYTPYYCEENIWHLCHEPHIAARQQRVVFISSPYRYCALWQQRAAGRSDAPILWDYHVVLLVRSASAWEVWDLDTVKGLPMPAEDWLAWTFLPLRSEYEYLAPRFRLLEPDLYRVHFSSDRSHMRTPDGDWQKPPPPWPAIIVPGEPSFMRWTHMAPNDPTCLDIDALRHWLD